MPNEDLAARLHSAALHLLRRLAQEDRATRHLGAAPVGALGPRVRRPAHDRVARRRRRRHPADDDPPGGRDGVGDGLVERLPDETDRRVVRVGRDRGRSPSPPRRPGSPRRDTRRDDRSGDAEGTPSDGRHRRGHRADARRNPLGERAGPSRSSATSGVAGGTLVRRGERECHATRRTRSRSSPAPAAGWAASPPRCSRPRGARVVVAEYNEAAGEETVELVRDAGGEATFVKADVSKEADAKAMVDHAVATYGRVDCLYNNAGIMPEADHSVTDTDVATWDAVMAVNVRGVFLGCKYADPGDDRRRRRLDHQHRELRGDRRLQRAAGCLHRVEGRRPRR